MAWDMTVPSEANPVITNSSSQLELVLQSRFENPENRKLETSKAAQERDLRGLVLLVWSYLRHKHVEYSPRTVNTYAIAIKWFLEFTENPRVELVKTTQDDVERFGDNLEPSPRLVAAKDTKHRHEIKPEKSPSLNFRNLYLAGISVLFKSLIRARVMTQNPVEEVLRIKVATVKGQQFRVSVDAETNALLIEPVRPIPKNPIRAARDAAMLRLGLLVDMRVGEITGLNLNDFSSKTLFIFGKGSNDRQVPISRRVAGILKHWQELRPVLDTDAYILSLSDRNYWGDSKGPARGIWWTSTSCLSSTVIALVGFTRCDERSARGQQRH
jgi:site-specific recombinase XerC